MSLPVVLVGLPQAQPWKSFPLSPPRHHPTVAYSTLEVSEKLRTQPRPSDQRLPSRPEAELPAYLPPIPPNSPSSLVWGGTLWAP